MDIILTGRAVSAEEALFMGLANRVIAKGKAVEHSMKIAEMMVKLPQLYMKNDRDSFSFAIYQTQSLEHALRYEFDHGREGISKESTNATGKFAAGHGRAGRL